MLFVNKIVARPFLLYFADNADHVAHPSLPSFPIFLALLPFLLFVQRDLINYDVVSNDDRSLCNGRRTKANR